MLRHFLRYFELNTLFFESLIEEWLKYTYHWKLYYYFIYFIIIFPMLFCCIIHFCLFVFVIFVVVHRIFECK